MAEVTYRRGDSDNRPWGRWEVLDTGDGFAVKRITVNPGAILSLQLHHHREEHWVIVRGRARVTRGERDVRARPQPGGVHPARDRPPDRESRHRGRSSSSRSRSATSSTRTTSSGWRTATAAVEGTGLSLTRLRPRCSAALAAPAPVPYLNVTQGHCGIGPIGR